MARLDPTDDHLARLAARGEADAFGQIYERHHQALYRYTLSLVKTPEDARDVLQTTMEKAFRAMPSQRAQGALKAWLFKIAHNESLSLIGRRQPLIEAGRESVAVAAHPAASVEAEERERLQQLVTDVNGLPERQRAALVMRELSGLSYDEIAVALAITPQVARQTAYEARSALFELGEGREMDCRRVRETISAGDRRFLRGRRMRAHLKGCANCTAFEQAIDARSADFAFLFPVLPAAAAAGVLKGVLVSGAVAGGVGGAGAAGGGAAAVAGGESSARTVALGLVVAGAVATAVAFAVLGKDSTPAPVKAPVTPPEAKAAELAPPPAPRKPRAKKPPPAKPPPAPVIAAAPAPTSLNQAYSGSNGEVVLPLSGSGSGQGGAGSTAGAGGASGGGGTLPFSGFDALLVALAGLGLLGLGVALRRLSPD